MRSCFFCNFVQAVALTSLLINLSPPLSAQDDDDSGPLAGHIVGKVWHTGVPFESSFSYLQDLRKELGMPDSPMVFMAPRVSLGPGTFAKSAPGKKETPTAVKGTLFVLQTLPQLSLNNPVSFSFVGDEQEFKRRLDADVAARGPATELIGEGDRYEVRINLDRLMAADKQASNAEDSDGETPKVRSFSIMIQADTSVGGNGKPPKLAKPLKAISTFYRYFEGVMYASSSRLLYSLDLPNQDELKLAEEPSRHDLYADFDLREVPLELKRGFWATLESSASTLLQRYDNEQQSDYALRRVLGEGKLELLRAAMFDVDRALFSLSLSPDGVEPVVSQLKIFARENSLLAQSFAAMSRGNSQLSVLKSDDAPFVLATTVQLPDWIRPFAGTFADSVRMKLRVAAGGDDGAGILVDNLMQPITDSVQSGILDAACSLQGSMEEGIVIAGGVRLLDAEHFLTSLESLLLVHSDPSQISVSRSLLGDYQVVSIRSPMTKIPGLKSSPTVNLHLVATGSWLWIASGGDALPTSLLDDPALQFLGSLVNSDVETRERAGEAIPLLVRFRLDKWLGESDQQFNQIPQELLTQLERWISRVTSPKVIAITMNGKAMNQPDPQKTEFKSYAKKVFSSQNSQLEIVARAAGQELMIDATVGTGVAKFFAAQYIESQNRMFSGMSFDFQMPQGGKKSQRVRISP
ncbi:MAG: hypothetical protein KDA91_04230 [Planctomycetaceae bacterium]|nr:hypothetical protein [Planctomycetaceae bacterium]